VSLRWFGLISADNWWVAKGFRPVDREQRFLLPVDMTEWLPAEHQVWLVLDVVDQLDLSVLTGRHPRGGPGRRAYDPAMMLALLVYGYATGVRSSRAIERACHTDVAFRVVCAQDPPDHIQIARFRQRHLDAFEDLFAQVLMVCARAGYVRLGIVAVDGTKIAANASIDAGHERGWYAAKAAEITAQAARVDAAEDAEFGPDRRGDEPPDGMSGRGAAGRAERAARLRRCLDEITAAEAGRAELTVAEKQAAVEYLAAARSGRARPGGPPRGTDMVAVAEARAERYASRYGPEHRFTRRARRLLDQARATPPATPAPAKPCRHGTHCRRRGCLPAPIQRNSTDPDSRLMPTRKGFIQGYNAQLAASADHFIIAADLVQDTGDVEQLQPMLTQAARTADALRPHRPDPATTHAAIGTVLADSGYCSHTNLTADGPDRLIATGKSRDLHIAATTHPASSPPPDHAHSKPCTTGSAPPTAPPSTRNAAPPSNPSTATSKTAPGYANSSSAACTPATPNSASPPSPTTCATSTAFNRHSHPASSTPSPPHRPTPATLNQNRNRLYNAPDPS
jgi:transposase